MVLPSRSIWKGRWLSRWREPEAMGVKGWVRAMAQLFVDAGVACAREDDGDELIRLQLRGSRVLNYKDNAPLCLESNSFSPS